MAAQETQATQQSSVSNGEVRIVKIMKPTHQTKVPTIDQSTANPIKRVNGIFASDLKSKTKLPVGVL